MPFMYGCPFLVYILKKCSFKSTIIVIMVFSHYKLDLLDWIEQFQLINMFKIEVELVTLCENWSQGVGSTHLLTFYVVLIIVTGMFTKFVNTNFLVKFHLSYSVFLQLHSNRILFRLKSLSSNLGIISFKVTTRWLFKQSSNSV